MQDAVTLRKNAIQNAISDAEQYGLTKADAQELLDKVDDEFYLMGEKNGGLVIEGPVYYDCRISDANQVQALVDAVHAGRPQQECLDSLRNEADWTTESFVSSRMQTIVTKWLEQKGVDLTKEENWSKQDAAFEFLNDEVAINFDRSYEQQKMPINVVISQYGELTVGSEDNYNKRQVQPFIRTLVEEQGHSMQELNAAFDEYSGVFLHPAYSEGADLFKAQEQRYGKFIASLACEIANSSPYNIDSYVFLTKLSVTDYAKLGDEDATITFQSGTMSGMFEPVDGSGSLLEVELEKEMTVPMSIVSELQIESSVEKHGYSYNVNEVYGLTAQCWDGKSEVHELSELDELPWPEKQGITVLVDGHEDGYYTGTVVVDGEKVAFAAKDESFKDEHGEVELTCYSEPGWMTGASFEKPLPESISGRYEEISESVNKGIDDYEREMAIRDAIGFDDSPHETPDPEIEI